MNVFKLSWLNIIQWLSVILITKVMKLIIIKLYAARSVKTEIFSPVHTFKYILSTEFINF